MREEEAEAKNLSGAIGHDEVGRMAAARQRHGGRNKQKEKEKTEEEEEEEVTDWVARNEGEGNSYGEREGGKVALAMALVVTDAKEKQTAR
ncbi:unnamed protein product [Soboliphyme baturini]|uniref:Uncharacterized protein n=1 Tax=Soboliphyme baturini TaxID=241478 RepID=A0A183IYU6_9BILA|nr:unnamed protein product [Soboliphyme baturini]